MCNYIDRDYTNYVYFLHDAERNVMRSINNSLQKFWQIEECASSEMPMLHSEEKRTLEVVENLLKWIGNCYEASIPWTMSLSELPCNFETALKRLYSTEKRLLKNSKLATAYMNVIDSYIKKGYMKKIEKQDNEAL